MTDPRTGPFGEGQSDGTPAGSQQPGMGAGPAGPGASGSGSGGLDPSGERYAGQDERYASQDERSAGQDERYQHPAGGGSTGAGSTGAGGTSRSGVSTTTRTSASQQTVPQQYGRVSDRDAGYGRDEGGYEPGEEERRRSDMGMGSDIIAATAGRAWPAVLAGGLGLLAVGIMLLVWPRESLTLVAILIGAALIVSGVVRLFEGFSAHRESGGMRAGYVVIGLLAVLAGVILLRHHALSLFLVAFVTGVYFIAHGISDLGVAFSGQAPARALRGVLGLFSIAAGILMVVWPSVTLVLLLTLVAAWLMFYGLVLSAIAFGLIRASRSAREHARRDAPRGRLATSAR
jgi:uncharacterized membrane protein HdeD (DUF308 family)